VIVGIVLERVLQRVSSSLSGLVVLVRRMHLCTSMNHTSTSRLQGVFTSLTLAAAVLVAACTQNEPLGPPPTDDSGPVANARAGNDAEPATGTGRASETTRTCDFATKYEYGYLGGFRAWVDRSHLAPGNMYSHSRTTFGAGGATRTCSPAMPKCGALDIITAYDIEVHDLGRADVQAALAKPTPPLFGRDTRPVDGVVFEFKRADGRGFLVGEPCADPGECRTIPVGIAQLKRRLLDLDRQQLAAPECQGLGTP
jgi:hypothetical protein